MIKKICSLSRPRARGELCGLQLHKQSGAPLWPNYTCLRARARCCTMSSTILLLLLLLVLLLLLLLLLHVLVHLLLLLLLLLLEGEVA